MPAIPDDRRYYLVTLGINTDRGLEVHSSLVRTHSPVAWYAKECTRKDVESGKLQQQIGDLGRIAEDHNLDHITLPDEVSVVPFAHLINIEEIPNETARTLIDEDIYVAVEDTY